tara:strand:- start:94 stop:330 length:237 start_codon:yes stop_codon:yes gene_type:complete
LAVWAHTVDAGGKVKFKRGDLVRIGWAVERGAKKPLLALVIGVNIHDDLNDQGYEVVSRAFFNGLDYVTHPDAVVKVS